MTIAKKIWDHFEEYTVVTMLAISACLIMLQVIMRYVLQNSLSWSEELAKYMFIWEVWLGVAYATKRKSQLRITVLRDRLNSNKLPFKLIEIVVMILWFCFGLFLIVVGFDMCMHVAALHQRSSALRIPMQYVYLGIPVGALLMNIRLVEIFVPFVLEIFRNKKNEEGESA